MKYVIGIALNFYLILILIATVLLSQNSSSYITKLPLDFISSKDYSSLPDFSAISDLAQKKQAFFNYFSPIIIDINKQILNQRKRIIKIRKELRRGLRLTNKREHVINSYAKFYGVDVQLNWLQKIEELLLRVNIIPSSLALAQAASESAWGTSRFATEGNNYFGQWCFVSGCGLTPKNRKVDAIHEVKYFSSAFDSVAAYIKNINTHNAYQELRKIRAQAIEKKMYPNGVLLADGLTNYSERKEHYINEIKVMIKTNGLESYVNLQ